MSRSLRTPALKGARIGPSSPVRITSILLTLLVGLLGGQHDAKAQGGTIERNAAPNLIMHANGKFLAKNNTSPATLWFPTGPGDPEGFLCRTASERTSILNMLNGGNTLYVMAVKTHGGDGPAGCNPWIGGNPANGLDTAKLNQWYDALDQVDNKGVVIYFFIYDDDSCPWGARTDCEARTSLQADERDFVDVLIDRFKTLSNLVWVVAEEYTDALRFQRAASIAARIQSRDTVHPVGIHQVGTDTSFDFPNDNNFDVFLLQMGMTIRSSQAIHDTIVTEYNAAAGRYGVVFAELLDWHPDLLDAGNRTNLRRSYWAAAMAGAAATLVLGTWAPQVTPPTQDMLDDMYRVHALLKGALKSDLSNADTAKSGTTLYVRKNSTSSKMLVYSETCTSVPHPGVTSLPSGTFLATWMNTVNGRKVTQTISSNGGSHNFGVPPAGIGAECVVWVRP
jgi:Protein of unknown function (DUF4038)